ncbi:MAG: hydroxyacid dehydrogenase [Patescibacteria group bacterium]|nr:hydroxyacid dehydrogenase [Patescibacteria group bacterium]MDE2015490.1 hydroxyacid dehydrogenase [Patescibacteria group bacterium]MDE2226894.1 hydroxyacid dehydrogenase [Patescibacteria group bacterium]
MNHKAIFFNFKYWGEGKDYVESSEKLKKAGVEVVFSGELLNKDSIPSEKDFDIAGVFMDSKVDASTISVLPELKFIATLSTGFDHIDLKAAAERGVQVSSVPAYGENTVAEFAFALLLALSRKIREASVRVKDEKKFSTDGLCGFDLAGKTLGVIGTGRIGKHAVRMGKGFGMKIVAYDVYHDDAFAKEMGYSYVSLEEILAESDVITIHCPYLPSTHHLINKNNIGLMKKGAYLINTARGAIVETPAVIAALKSGQLGGAGLDVLEEEANMKAGDMSLDRELVMMPNVIVTPHNAFNTKEAFQRILETTIDNIVAFTEGKPVNLVPNK